MNLAQEIMNLKNERDRAVQNKAQATGGIEMLKQQLSQMGIASMEELDAELTRINQALTKETTALEKKVLAAKEALGI
jgi:hypothetical protein